MSVGLRCLTPLSTIFQLYRGVKYVGYSLHNITGFLYYMLIHIDFYSASLLLNERPLKKVYLHILDQYIH